LVHSLTAHLEYVGNRLPAPSLLTGVGDLYVFEAVCQRSQCSHRRQPFRRIAVCNCCGDVIVFLHYVKLS
jgi:hypothetical protein